MQTRLMNVLTPLLACGVLWASRALGQNNVSLPFLGDEFSVFATPLATGSPNRQFNFTLPSGPPSYPDLTSVLTATLLPGDFTAALNPTSPEEAQADVPYTSCIGEWFDQALGAAATTDVFPCPPNQPVSGNAGVVLECDVGMYIMTQDNLRDELVNRQVPALGSSLFSYSYQEVDMDFIIKGGQFDGNEVQLHGEMAYGSGLDTNTYPDPTVGEGPIGNMMIALNWGVDPLGNTNYVLVNLEFAASASTEYPTCLPEAEVCQNFYGSSTVSAYFNPQWQALMSELGNGKMYLTGAIPELLYLYDFSGTYTQSPASTMPPQWLTYATVLDASNTVFSDGYTNVYQIANQYDAGNAYSLPSRFTHPGGNACGPTSLGMMLNAWGVAPVSPVSDFDNTTVLGYNVPPNTPNGFTWSGRAYEWLAGQQATRDQVPFSAPSPLPSGSPVWERKVTGNSLSDAAITGMWKNIDKLLYNGQPVEIRTDLGIGTAPGGGHCILALGISFNPDLPKLYGDSGVSISGNYYIVADPAGHYFANSSGTHYSTCRGLFELNAGINYGGWFAIYPKELLQQRISDTGSTNYSYRMEALTIGSPIVAPSTRASAHSPVAILITDPIGRQTGVQANGTIVQNIPSSYYEWASIDEEEQGTSSVDPFGPKNIDIDTPMDGVYQVELIGTNTGTYELDWVPINSNGAIIQTATNSGTTSTGQQTNYTFTLQLGGTPSIEFVTAGNALALFWATNAAGFSLQSSTNLGNPSNWTTLSGPFFQTNGVYALTNVISGAQKFYRLRN